MTRIGRGDREVPLSFDTRSVVRAATLPTASQIDAADGTRALRNCEVNDERNRQPMNVRWWHYALATTVLPIIAGNTVKRATLCVENGEITCVWLFCRPVSNPSANTAIIDLQTGAWWSKTQEREGGAGIGRMPHRAFTLRKERDTMMLTKEIRQLVENATVRLSPKTVRGC